MQTPNASLCAIFCKYRATSVNLRSLLSTIPKLSRKAIGDGLLSSACPILHDEYDMVFQLCLAKPYPR